MKWLKEYEDLLRARYLRLYGQAECELWIRQEKKKLLVQFLLTLLILGLLIYNNISVSRAEYENVKVSKNGEIVEIVRPGLGEESYSFSTKVKIISDEGEQEKEYYITIEPIGEADTAEEGETLPEPSHQDQSEAQLKQLISGLNSDTEEQTVILPDQLENGDELVWMKAENTDPIFYCIGGMVLLWFIYRSRFYTINQEEKKARESIIKELPEFINKLVLLINAGVILNTAFLKIVGDCDETKAKNSYFYKRISDIAHLMEETNASFHQEMYNFAKYSGVKELMRITNIMLDNISKGDDLSDKLKRENELLWFARKQQAEEKGRLAETKLTLPLMILLTVLIMVTIAPALMEI